MFPEDSPGGRTWGTSRNKGGSGVAFQVEGLPVQELVPRGQDASRAWREGWPGCPRPEPTPREECHRVATALSRQRPLTLTGPSLPPSLCSGPRAPTWRRPMPDCAFRPRGVVHPPRLLSPRVWSRAELGRCALTVLWERWDYVVPPALSPELGGGTGGGL